MIQLNYESSKVVLDPVTSLSMLGSRSFGALTCDSAMALGEKHRFAFEAVCVICQYQLENGLPLLDV
jgi:hypothetical protein